MVGTLLAVLDSLVPSTGVVEPVKKLPGFIFIGPNDDDIIGGISEGGGGPDTVGFVCVGFNTSTYIERVPNFPPLFNLLRE